MTKKYLFGTILMILFIPSSLYVFLLIFQGKSIDEIIPYIMGSIVLLGIGFLLRSKKM
ncbi:hypothetical protein [Nitrosarchaeum sp.]|uniref:hypothetical protein n=1 Tax=Nitrosarchaeum sp. TaxID=2026886 RepID=UPI00247D2C7C|nr:hypothetical protein [Nitrosarchaeum sp.]MCV0412818.1 hypothetical protein [Nitrosarchaeum sp.]